MIDLTSALPALHVSVNSPFFPRPFESHAVFGAGFILMGGMMLAETLAGGVWYRSRARTMMFPVTLSVMGAGMIAVTVVEPSARIAHLAMGTPMTVGGWAEAKSREGLLRRRYADGLLIAGLLFASFETAAYHLSGSSNNGVYASHLGIVIAGVALAALRLFQSREPTSLLRSLLIDVAILLIGLDLFMDGMFQPRV
jgi:hypothetical protein